MFTLPSTFISSPVRWPVVPMPWEAKEMLPGRARSALIRSAMERAGLSAGTASRPGISQISVTGAKSRSGS
jgi:hypothetical protein